MTEPLDPEIVETVRVAIYQHLARTGRLPDLRDVEAIAGSAVRLGEVVQQLAATRHLALAADGSIALAHPFATRSFGFSVMSETTLWWGGCAWDSFAIPHLVPDAGEVLIATACPACGRALAWRVGRDGPPSGGERAHFLVPAKHIWDDVIHTCSNQLLFCDDSCIDTWLARQGHDEGYRLDLDTLWRFAAHWYDGRLEHGYQRRDPVTASAYIASCGLTGPFWSTG